MSSVLADHEDGAFKIVAVVTARGKVCFFPGGSRNMLFALAADPAYFALGIL